jgi:hypothetical protein
MGKEQIIKKLIDELAAVAKMEGKARTGAGVKGASGANTAQQKANFEKAKQKLIEKARAEREAAKKADYERLQNKGVNVDEIKKSVQANAEKVKSNKEEVISQDKRTRYPKEEPNAANRFTFKTEGQTTGGLTERPSRVIGRQGENAPIARASGTRESTESQVRSSMQNQLDALRKQWTKATTEAQKNAIAKKAAEIKKKLGN